MIFVKPENVRYVDMCIWCDENAYTENCDNEKLYQYLYFIAIMLAHKAKYFNKVKDYEDFALYMASQTYYRLKNPKQYQIDDNGNPKMTKLKSVLNYMKSTLYPRKVDFQQQNYAQTQISIDDTDYYSEYSFLDRLEDTIDELTLVEFEACLQDTVHTIKYFLNRIPYRKGTAEWQNIYMSCLLTFLDSITLSNNDIRRIKNYSRNTSNKYFALINDYKEQSDCVTLFHLDEKYRDYILILVREIKRIIANDLSSSIKSYVPTRQSMALVAMSSINGEMTNENQN